MVPKMDNITFFVDAMFISQYGLHAKGLSKQEMCKERNVLLGLLDGDVFYPMKIWPRWLKLMFWKKPLSDSETFKVFLFFIGNGCPPSVISKWIITSLYWSMNRRAWDKRARQLTFIVNNAKSKQKTWFYYDLHNKEVLYLDGSERVRRS